MIFEYALILMIGVVILNIAGDGFVVAGVFLLVSLTAGYILSHTAHVESYAVYAACELLFIHIISSLYMRSTLIIDMINISRLSIFFQLVGVVLWIEYYDSSIYLMLCELAFIMQTLRLAAHGFSARKVADPGIGFMDYLHTNIRGEKL